MMHLAFIGVSLSSPPPPYEILGGPACASRDPTQKNERRPPMPAFISCKTTPGGLRLTAFANVALADQISFSLKVVGDEIYKHHMSAHVALPSGRAVVEITALPGFTMFDVAIRAHRRGCAEDGEAWSDVVDVGTTCKTEATPAPFNTGPAADENSHWLEVFRVTEFSNAAIPQDLPDFLDAHDSGDLIGASMITSIWGAAASTTYTRYCIRVLNVNVTGISTGVVDGGVVSLPYTEYASTNPAFSVARYAPSVEQQAWFTPAAQYQTNCALLSDRMIAHMPLAHLKSKGCIGTHGLCNCSDTVMVNDIPMSAKEAIYVYTGMEVVALPYFFKVAKVGEYPGALKEPLGKWYSHPSSTRCALGLRLGSNGCTWQRSPRSHSVSGSDLLDAGFGNSENWRELAKRPGDNVGQNTTVLLKNIEAFRQAFMRVHGDLSKCGV